MIWDLKTDINEVVSEINTLSDMLQKIKDKMHADSTLQALSVVMDDVCCARNFGTILMC